MRITKWMILFCIDSGSSPEPNRRFSFACPPR
jgi:hypothetical protein